MMLLVQGMERVQMYVLYTWQAVIARLKSPNKDPSWVWANEILLCVCGHFR